MNNLKNLNFTSPNEIISYIKNEITNKPYVHTHLFMATDEAHWKELLDENGGITEPIPSFYSEIEKHSKSSYEELELLLDECINTPCFKSINGKWVEFYELDIFGKYGTLRICFPLSKIVSFRYSFFERFFSFGITQHNFWKYEMVNNKWQIKND